jgi:hypothetical protein
MRKEGDTTITTTTGTSSYTLPPSFPIPEILLAPSDRRFESPSHPQARSQSQATSSKSEYNSMRSANPQRAQRSPRPQSPVSDPFIPTFPFPPQTQAPLPFTQNSNPTSTQSPVSPPHRQISRATTPEHPGSPVDDPFIPPIPSFPTQAPYTQHSNSNSSKTQETPSKDGSSGLVKARVTRPRNDSVSSQPPSIPFGFGVVEDEGETKGRGSTGGVRFSWGGFGAG